MTDNTQELDDNKLEQIIADHICLRYSARIAELRKEGHIIVAHHIKDGLFEYIYKGTIEDEFARDLAIITA